MQHRPSLCGKRQSRERIAGRTAPRGDRALVLRQRAAIDAFAGRQNHRQLHRFARDGVEEVFGKVVAATARLAAGRRRSSRAIGRIGGRWNRGIVCISSTITTSIETECRRRRCGPVRQPALSRLCGHCGRRHTENAHQTQCRNATVERVFDADANLLHGASLATCAWIEGAAQQCSSR